MKSTYHAICRRSLLLATFLGLACAGAQAQTYPTRSIELLVGYSAGGGMDTAARMLAPRLSALLGQQVVVENRAGAAGLIAGDVVAKATPDGYTLLLGESGLLVAPYLHSHMTFDPIKSFAPVASVFNLPLMVVTNNDFPAKTPKEFVALLQANPGKYSFASPGVGSLQHLGFEMFTSQIHASVVHIPYQGAAAIVPAVISDQVPIGVVSVASGIAQVKAGQLRAMALMSPVKIAGAENIPPLSEVIPGFNVSPKLFLLAPAGTPASVIERLSDAVHTVLASPDLAAKAAALLGGVPAYMAAGPLAVDLRHESATWGGIVRKLKIAPQ